MLVESMILTAQETAHLAGDEDAVQLLNVRSLEKRPVVNGRGAIGVG